jgi:hypothetical protein
MSRNSFGLLSKRSLAIIIILICFIGTLVYVIVSKNRSTDKFTFTKFPSEVTTKNGDATFTTLTSPDGRCSAVMQQDGNLVIYDSTIGKPIWASNTNGKGSGGPYKIIMQRDANLVIYDRTGKAIWASNSGGKYTMKTGPIKVSMDDDGRLAVYDTMLGVKIAERNLWRSNNDSLFNTFPTESYHA